MKNLKKLMSLLLALLMLTGNMAAALATDTDIVAVGTVHPSELIQVYAIDHSSDLRDFVTGFQIIDANGTDVTDSTILYDGVNYTFKINFKETNSLQFGLGADNKMHYTLPEGFTYNGTGSFPAKDDQGRTTGMFEVANGEVTFTPWYYNAKTDTYYQERKESTDKSFLDMYSDAELWCNLQGTVSIKEGQQEIKFSDTIKKQFTVEQEQKKPYADVTKTNADQTIYDDGDGKGKYFLTTIVATVKDGDPDELTIIDNIEWLHAEINKPDRDSFTISQIRDGVKNPMTDIVPTWNESNGGFELTLNSGNVTGGLKENDQYEITYKSYLTEAGANYIGTNENWCEYNTVKTKIDDQEKSSDLVYKIAGKPEIVKKSASTDANDPNVINWHIEIGDNLMTDIAGKTITDTWNEHLASGETAKLDEISMVDDSRRIRLTVRKADGSTATIDVPASEVGSYFTPTTVDGKQTGFTFEVPKASGEYAGASVIKCEVDYQTKATTKNEHGTFKIDNKAEYEDGRGGSASGDGGVSGLDDFEIAKTFEGEDGDELKFKMEILIPSEARGQQIYVSDWSYLNGWDWNNNSLSLELSTVRITATDGEIQQDFTKGYGRYTYQNTTQHAGILFFFNLPEGHVLSNDYTKNKEKSIWQWESNRDVTMTIEYSVKKPTEFKGNPVSSGIVYNKAYIELGDKKKGDQVSAPFGKHARIDKTARLNGDGTIDYTVTINGNYTAPIPENAVFTDTFDSEHLAYVADSLNVTILARVNQYTTHTIGRPKYSNPQLGKNGVISIQFDEFGQNGWNAGETGYPGAIGLDWSDYPNIKNWYRLSYKTDESYNDGGQKINFQQTLYVAVQFTYKLKIKNVQPGETQVLNNTAKIDHYDDASASVTYKPTLLEKTVDKIQGATLSYTINVNPSGMKMLSGTGNLRLIDEMSPNLAPLLKTLKVYKKDGYNLTELTHGSGAGQWMYAYDSETNTLELSLPDEMALVVKYDAKVQGEVGDNVQVNNQATLQGFADASSKSNQFTITNAAGGSSGTLYELALFKMAKESGMPLAGAKFQIDWTKGDSHMWEKFHEFTTTEDGMAEISYGDSAGHPVFADTLYRITEVSAPDGYQKLTEPIYVYIKRDKTKTEADIIAEALADLENESEEEKAKVRQAKIKGLANSELVVIANEPKPGIEFIKVSAADNNTLGGAEFELTRADNDTWKRTATSQLNGAVSFPDVPEGTYRLVETKAPTGYTRSRGYWTVEVEDANGVRTVTYTAHDGARAIGQDERGFVLTNEEFPNLPSVGGNGTLAYSLFGLALMAAASAAAYALTRKRRRIEQ